MEEGSAEGGVSGGRGQQRRGQQRSGPQRRSATHSPCSYPQHSTLHRPPCLKPSSTSSFQHHHPL